MTRSKAAAALNKLWQTINVHQTKDKAARLGKLTAVDRINSVVDNGKFYELSPFSSLKVPYGPLPRSSLMAGLCTIAGQPCVVMANDWMVKGGTLYPCSVKKQLRMQEIALRCAIPFIFLVDSGGAFLPLQSEIFPDKLHGGRVFYNQAILNFRSIPQIAVVLGSCTAGGAYIPTMSQHAIIVDKIGHIFLGGPPLVKAALGTNVSADELGGSDLHSRISGCVDHRARDEAEAFKICRQLVACLQSEGKPAALPFPNQPITDGSTADDDRIPLMNSVEIIRQFIACPIDGSDEAVLEFKPLYGANLFAGWVQLSDRRRIGVVANKGDGGVATGDDCLKAAHFVQLCQQTDTPLLFIHNQKAAAARSAISGNQHNHVAMEANLMRAVATATVPKITLLCGGSYGSNYWTLCPPSFEADFTFAWPWADVCPTPTNPATAETDRFDFDNLNFPALIHTSSLYDDGLLLPSQTNQVLNFCFELLRRRPFAARQVADGATLKFC